MSRPAQQRSSARPRRGGKPARKPAASSEAQNLASAAAAFGLFGLRIALDEAALWSDSAAAYRLGTSPLDAPANDIEVKAPPAFPTLKSRAYLSPTVPARLIRAIDWLISAVAAEVAALWGAGASLTALPLGEAAAFLLAVGALKAGVWLTAVYRTPLPRVRPEGAIGGLALGAIMGLTLAALLAPDARSAAALAAVLPAAALLLAGVHAALAIWTAAAHRAGVFSERIVLIGATEAARRLALSAAETGDAQILAIADDRTSRAPARVADPPAGSVEELMAWDGLPHVDRIVIALPQRAERRAGALVERLRALPNRIDVLLDHDAASVRGGGTNRLGGLALVCVSGGRRAEAPLKRVFDVSGAVLLLAVFALPMLAVAAAIRLESRGRALHRQPRVGLNNRVFMLYTFRTRLLNLPRTRKGVDALTRLGRFLERTRLDDLPQLFNVLRGDMSLVGPRPHAPDVRVSGRDLRRIVAEYAHRHRVKPGLISWAHLHGAHGPLKTIASVRRRVQLDLDYVARASLGFDMQILATAMWRALGSP